MATPPQPTTPELINKSDRDTEETSIEDLIPAQINDGDDQHDGGEGRQPHVEHDMEATPVETTEARPVRQRKPNMRYPATEFDLNSVRTRSRRILSRAK